MWVNIKDFENYQVNTKGEIRNLKTSKSLTNSKHTKGYMRVALNKDGKSSFKYVHRIVAEMFLENPRDCSQVHHKDGDKTNNNTTNLEWVSPSNHAILTNISNAQKEYKPIPVICVKVDGTEIMNFDSVEEACFEMKVSVNDILNVLNSKTKATNNYYYLYRFDDITGI